MTRLSTILAIVACAAVPLACGDDGDDDNGAAAPAPGAVSGDIGEPVMVTNNRDVTVDDGDRVTDGADSELTEGAPPIDVLEEIDPALPSTLAEDRASCGTVDIRPDPGNLDQISNIVICLLNAERTSRNLAALARNGRLDQGGLVHSRDMVAKKFFDHAAPNGDRVDDRLRQAGYIRRGVSFVVGENLGWGAGASASPEGIVRAWMDSPAHRANILHPRFKEIGLGTVDGAPVAGEDAGTTFTTTFGVITRARATRSRARRR